MLRIHIYIYFLEKFKEMQQVKLSAPKHELHALPKQRFQRKILPSKLSKLRFKLHRITSLKLCKTSYQIHEISCQNRELHLLQRSIKGKIKKKRKKETIEFPAVNLT